MLLVQYMKGPHDYMFMVGLNCLCSAWREKIVVCLESSLGEDNGYLVVVEEMRRIHFLLQYYFTYSMSCYLDWKIGLLVIKKTMA